MQVAINYSHEASELLESGAIKVDVFKCPAWHDIVNEAMAVKPVYVHFPLNMGVDLDSAIDTETHKPVDWAYKVESLLETTGTPYVNLHLAPEAKDYPGMEVRTFSGHDTACIVENAIRTIEAAVRRFGSDKVILENVPDAGESIMRPALLPEVFNQIVEATGCGFLLDISHARIAADYLGVDARDYINALPVDRLREIHVTGIHRMTDKMLDMLNVGGVHNSGYERLVGRLVDHLPFAENDWEFLDWCMAQIRAGVWSEPWVVAFEYGGIGGLWELIGNREVIAAQMPRLYETIKSSTPLKTE